jgi:FAD/FMN-containing dehydrogenase
MAKSVDKELEKAQELYESTDAAEDTGGKKYKDGEYVCKLTSMEIELAKSSGRLQVKGIFEAVEPEKYEGVEIWKFWGLDEQGMPYFKLAANKLGMDLPSKTSKLPKYLEEFVSDFESLVDVTVATKDGRSNVYVNGIHEGEEPEKKEPEEDEERDDLIRKIKKNKLDVDPDDYSDNEELEEAIDKAMKKKKK